MRSISTAGEMTSIACATAGQMPDPRAILDRRTVREGGAGKSMMTPIFPNENEKGGILSKTGAIQFTKEMDRRGLKWETFILLQTLGMWLCVRL